MYRSLNIQKIEEVHNAIKFKSTKYWKYKILEIQNILIKIQIYNNKKCRKYTLNKTLHIKIKEIKCCSTKLKVQNTEHTNLRNYVYITNK